MAFTMQGRSLVKELLSPFATTSDGKTGSYVDYNGYNRALITFQGGVATTGDSDDTLIFQMYRVDDIAAASAAATDHVAITAGLVTMVAASDSDADYGLGFIDLDLVAHGMDNGCLNVIATPSPGAVIPCSSVIQLYNRNGVNSDTGMTIVTPASS